MNWNIIIDSDNFPYKEKEYGWNVPDCIETKEECNKENCPYKEEK